MKPRHRARPRRRSLVIACILAAVALLLGLGSAYARVGSVPAARTAVSTPAVTEDQMGPSVAAAGEQVTASLTVHSAVPLKVDAIGVVVYDSSGHNLGFSGNTAPVIPPTGYTYTSKPRSFAAGVYRILGAYRVGTRWTDLPAGVLTVSAAPVTPSPTPTSAGPAGIAGTWHKVFDDEFNGTSLDLSVWQPGWLSDAQVTGPVNTLEDQKYTRANVTVSGGSLHLALNSLGSLVNTNGHFNPVHGVFESRVFLPGGGGTVDNWPAVWQDGQNWPTDGENDVMEGLSGGTACHFHSSSPAGGSDGGCSNTGSGWHVFASDWEPGSVTYYYDGAMVGRITSGVTNAPMYLILNNTSGKGVGGPRTPADMLVDWVRYWQH